MKRLVICLEREEKVVRAMDKERQVLEKKRAAILDKEKKLEAKENEIESESMEVGEIKEELSSKEKIIEEQGLCGVNEYLKGAKILKLSFFGVSIEG